MSALAGKLLVFSQLAFINNDHENFISAIGYHFIKKTVWLVAKLIRCHRHGTGKFGQKVCAAKTKFAKKLSAMFDKFLYRLCHSNLTFFYICVLYKNQILKVVSTVESVFFSE
jgi:hypothetical protein